MALELGDKGAHSFHDWVGLGGGSWSLAARSIWRCGQLTAPVNSLLADRGAVGPRGSLFLPPHTHQEESLLKRVDYKLKVYERVSIYPHLLLIDFLPFLFNWFRNLKIIYGGIIWFSFFSYSMGFYLLATWYIHIYEAKPIHKGLGKQGSARSTLPQILVCCWLLVWLWATYLPLLTLLFSCIKLNPPHRTTMRIK